jgi:hypothetical protein
MSQWVLPTTRWAIYLRDGLSCVYCQVTLDDLLAERGGNFLTLDHVKARKHGGCNSPHNLVAACYACNSAKARHSVAQFCRVQGLNASTIRSRIGNRRSRDIDQYRLAARLLLGKTVGIPGLSMVQAVIDHDWLVKRQWGDSIDGDYWAHLKAQEDLFCSTCNAARGVNEAEDRGNVISLASARAASGDLVVADVYAEKIPF